MLTLILTHLAAVLITLAAARWLMPTIGDMCDRHRFYIATRRRHRELRIATSKSIEWHCRAKYASEVGRHRRARRASLIADQWDARLAFVADTSNIDWMRPSWVPVLPITDRHHQAQQKARRTRNSQPRKAKVAPRLDTVRS